MATLLDQWIKGTPTEKFPIELTPLFEIQKKVANGCHAKYPDNRDPKWEGCIAGHQELFSNLLEEGGYFKKGFEFKWG